MKTLSKFGLGLIVLMASAVSNATLGEHKSTIDSDIARLKGSQKASTSSELFTAHETVADGNTIKEYANADGVIFAVSWRGISKPDLSVLFGTYFDEYKNTLAKSPKQHGKRSVSMETSRMVIKRGGRMRDQRGFAYVPSLVPEGLNLEDLE